MRNEWLEKRLAELKKPKSGLADAMGLPPARITEMISGDRQIRAAEVPAMAAYLEWPEIVLLSTISGGAVSPTALGTVKVIGEVQAGVWREALEWPEEDQYVAPVAAEPSYAQFRQFGLRVRGPSMNEIYPDGSIAICVNLIELGRDPKPGQRVVVLRRSNAGADIGFEATIKELRRDDAGDYWLWPRSTDPNFQTPWKLQHEYAHDDNEDIRIVSLVIGSYRPEA